MIGASRALIHHKNEMGSSFRLIKAAFALDGVQIAAKSEGNLAELQEFDVYNGAIQPGSHTLSVALTYQGNGFGVFSYLKGYKFNVKSSHTFVAGESKSTNITVVGYEKGNITNPQRKIPIPNDVMSLLRLALRGLILEGPTSAVTGSGAVIKSKWVFYQEPQVRSIPSPFLVLCLRVRGPRRSREPKSERPAEAGPARWIRAARPSPRRSPR